MNLARLLKIANGESIRSRIDCGAASKVEFSLM